MSQSKLIGISVGMMICFLAIVGCRDLQTLGTGSINDRPVGVVNDTDGFTVRSVDSNSNYTHVVHATPGTFATPCVVTSTSTNKDITCLIEGEELDLYYWGAAIQYNVPSTMCTYLKVIPPWYYSHQVSVGPSTVTYDVDAAGQKVNFVTVPANQAALTTSGVVCNYDYSHNVPAGPNCCIGSYTLTTRTWDAVAGAYTAPASRTEVWGGRPGDCIDGPATTSDGFGRLADNMPVNRIYYVKNIGANDAFRITAPISTSRGSNLYIANYFNIADHGGNVPLAFRQPTDSLAVAIPGTVAGQPYHEFQCLDQAHEVTARIRVMIREWNLVSEFLKADAGNPDLGEGLPDPISGSQNDYMDWKDLGAFFPGSGI